MTLIDKETIRAEIERRMALITDVKRRWKVSPFADGSIDTLTGLLAFLDTLPEQPVEGLHFTPLNRLIQKIPSKNWNDTVNNYAKKLRDCLIKEGYLKDAKVLQDYISYMNGNNVSMATMDEQEQPVEGLEEEISSYWNRVTGYQPKFAVLELKKEDLAKVASHFYELGCRRTAEKYDDIEYNRQRAEEAELSEDLEDEVKRYWNAHALDYRIGRVADLDFMFLCARHFYELGQQSRPKKSDNSLGELRKEVIKFNQDHFDELHSDMETIDIVHIVARHFAEWGATHLKKYAEF